MTCTFYTVDIEKHSSREVVHISWRLNFLPSHDRLQLAVVRTGLTIYPITNGECVWVVLVTRDIAIWLGKGLLLLIWLMSP